MLLETSEGGTVSIASLGKGLISKTGEPGLLAERLAEAGCEDPTSPKWNRLSFIHAVTEFYEVGAGFPRIVPLSFQTERPPAGTKIKAYEIDLALARAFQLDPRKTDEMMERLLSCLT